MGIRESRVRGGEVRDLQPQRRGLIHPHVEGLRIPPASTNEGGVVGMVWVSAHVDAGEHWPLPTATGTSPRLAVDQLAVSAGGRSRAGLLVKSKKGSNSAVTSRKARIWYERPDGPG